MLQKYSWCTGNGQASQPDRRRVRMAPKGRLWPGWRGCYPALLPDPWYPLHTASDPDPEYVWLQTAHGMTRVQRVHVELRGT